MTPLVDIRWRKWDDSEHWFSRAIPLGTDHWGTWFGHLPGARYTRPGRDFLGDTENIGLVPAHGEWVATFYPDTHPGSFRVYIDLAWGVRWTDEGLTAIDMDLDVIRLDSGHTFIDDEDEFAEHSVHYGYPTDVHAAVEAAAADLELRVRNRTAPFDDTSDRWFAALADSAAS